MYMRTFANSMAGKRCTVQSKREMEGRIEEFEAEEARKSNEKEK